MATVAKNIFISVTNWKKCVEKLAPNLLSFIIPSSFIRRHQKKNKTPKKFFELKVMRYLFTVKTKSTTS